MDAVGHSTKEYLTLQREWLVPARQCLRKFVQDSAAAEDIWDVLGRPDCTFGDVQFLMECLGGVAKIKAHVASHLLVKTVLAVESRSPRYYRLLSDNDIWDLVWFGLRKSSDPDVWTLCLKVSRDNYKYLVDFRSLSTTVNNVRNMLDVVVDRHGRTLAQRSLSSAEVLMDFLKSAVLDKFFFRWTCV